MDDTPFLNTSVTIIMKKVAGRKSDNFSSISFVTDD